MEICTALRRLGYIDKPSVGDHIRFFKLVEDHPEGRITIQVGLDTGHAGRSDVDRIRERTKLEDDGMWKQALKKKLPVEEYNKHLLQYPKSELVHEFWRDRFQQPG